MLSSEQRGVFAALAETLIPASETMPSATTAELPMPFSTRSSATDPISSTRSHGRWHSAPDATPNRRSTRSPPSSPTSSKP